MGKILSVFNQKGGVGKTTVNINLAAGLARRRKSVLVIDMDPQCNTTTGFGIHPEQGHSVYEWLRGELSFDEARQHPIKNMDIIPGSRDMAAFDLEMASVADRESLLKKQLDPLREQYDFILIDCPPALGLLSVNALVASDSILIPIQSEYYALEGLSALMDTVKRIQSSINPELSVEGVLLNMVDRRNNLSRDVADEVEKYFGEKVYKTQIPRNVRLAEAPSYGMSIFDYDNLSRGAWAFGAWVKEFLRRSENG
ncbi:MAG TPA: ParA family protein [Tissierellia bacterium]|jgi:chromosome partitioning protein|nr:ParA family protein [Tissierellia bacterium]